jgi:hypothetical protein
MLTPQMPTPVQQQVHDGRAEHQRAAKVPQKEGATTAPTPLQHEPGDLVGDARVAPAGASSTDGAALLIPCPHRPSPSSGTTRAR